MQIAIARLVPLAANLIQWLEQPSHRSQILESCQIARLDFFGRTRLGLMLIAAVIIFRSPLVELSSADRFRAAFRHCCESKWQE